jgi:hypothetical protein
MWKIQTPSQRAVGGMRCEISAVSMRVISDLETGYQGWPAVIFEVTDQLAT